MRLRGRGRLLDPVRSVNKDRTDGLKVITSRPRRKVPRFISPESHAPAANAAGPDGRSFRIAPPRSLPFVPVARVCRAPRRRSRVAFPQTARRYASCRTTSALVVLQTTGYKTQRNTMQVASANLFDTIFRTTSRHPSSPRGSTRRPMMPRCSPVSAQSVSNSRRFSICSGIRFRIPRISMPTT